MPATIGSTIQLTGEPRRIQMPARRGNMGERRAAPGERCSGSTLDPVRAVHKETGLVWTVVTRLRTAVVVTADGPEGAAPAAVRTGSATAASRIATAAVKRAP